MNRYEHTFAATCPSDGASVIYHLTLKSEETVIVEDIIAFCANFDGAQYHETIADALATRFGGKQKVRALHQSVHITTTRPAK